MKMSGGPASLNLKLILLSIAVLLAAGTLIYTQYLVKELQEEEREIAELYANSFQYFLNSELESSDFTFVFENIVKPIDFPLILSDGKNNVSGINTAVRNLEIDTTLSDSEVQAFLQKKIDEFDNMNDPIPVLYENEIIQKIHYGESELVTRLRYYPYIQILMAFLFILIAYVSFSYVKKNEQSNIWVGMSKETAHQLGTPISSLMGWNEILKMSSTDPDKVTDISNEIDGDLNRLNKIANRFSKIGSKPELKNVNLFELIERVIQYFERRLSHSDTDTKLFISGDNLISSKINTELFEWVIENLIKNALDAIDKENGKIQFNISSHKKFIEISVSDNGKGIERKRFKDVFRPGYSTKKRGWGLGLSLAKRIVEEYHNGNIFVFSSEPGNGTTFKIILNKSPRN